MCNDLRDAKADAWDTGALWAAVECGVIEDEAEPFLHPTDNPYRGGDDG